MVKQPGVALSELQNVRFPTEVILSRISIRNTVTTLFMYTYVYAIMGLVNDVI